MRKLTKKQMIALCKDYKITIPWRPTRKQLYALLFSFYSDAAVIKQGNRYELLQTDKDSTKFSVDFNLLGNYTVRAESEDAAISWVSEYLEYFYDLEPDEFQRYEMIDFGIVCVEVCESEADCESENECNNE